jgi:hypothetical protein
MILILESRRARNKAFSERFFGVLASQNRLLFSPPERPSSLTTLVNLHGIRSAFLVDDSELF